MRLNPLRFALVTSAVILLGSNQSALANCHLEFFQENDDFHNSSHFGVGPLSLTSDVHDGVGTRGGNASGAVYTGNFPAAFTAYALSDLSSGLVFYDPVDWNVFNSLSHATAGIDTIHYYPSTGSLYPFTAMWADTYNCVGLDPRCRADVFAVSGNNRRRMGWSSFTGTPTKVIEFDGGGLDMEGFNDEKRYCYTRDGSTVRVGELFKAFETTAITIPTPFTDRIDSGNRLGCSMARHDGRLYVATRNNNAELVWNVSTTGRSWGSAFTEPSIQVADTGIEGVQLISFKDKLYAFWTNASRQVQYACMEDEGVWSGTFDLGGQPARAAWAFPEVEYVVTSGVELLMVSYQQDCSVCSLPKGDRVAFFQ